MMKNFLKYIFVCLLACLAVSCQQDEPITDAGEMVLSYSVKMPTMDASRVAVDGSKVNTLTVEVFEQDGEVWRSAYRKAGIMKNADGKFIIDVPMMKGRSYKVVFWAQNSEVTAYNTEDLSHIQVDYDNYRSGFESVENLDAFYYVDKVDDLKSESNGNVELKRPFVFLNIDNQSEYTPVSTTLTVKQAYTSFYPLKGEMGNPLQNQEFVFNGAKDDGTIAACLVFVPSESSLGVSLEISNGTSVTTKDVTIEKVQTNHRYNLEGELVGAPMTHWSDKTELPYYDEANNRYIIQNEAQLAWWMDPVAEELKEGATEILIKQNLDMQDIPMDALQLPVGITLNGNGKTIERLKLSGGLLGDATNLEVLDLVISQAKVEATSGHVGVLVNTLTGSSTFTGVSVSNSSATTASGAAGGMVGYITNKEGETLEVTFSDCEATDNKVNGSLTSGVYVGRFRGYDNSETLTFSSCNESSATIEGTNPYYVEGNEATWLARNDYSDYSGWLGNEEYYRGTVRFGYVDESNKGIQFIPKWDGTTTVEPILYNNTNNQFEVYSPFDLAGVRAKTASPAAIYLRADIDMNGQGADGEFNVPNNFTQSAYSSTDDNNFNPFSYVTTLDGKKSDTENYSIYNLAITQLQQERAAFILYASGTTSHKNINFCNCQTVAVHKPVETDAKAYGAILVSNVDATSYTMDNVHAYDCKVFALQKVGTLLARVAADNSYLRNSSVNNCYVENYECLINERFSSGEQDLSIPLEIFNTTKYFDATVEVYENYYPHGEVGGMIGFLQKKSELENLHVRNTTVHAFGQGDKMAEVNVIKTDSKFLNNTTAKAGLLLMGGYYLIPGRHVSTFIGDIRNAGTTTIANCTVDNESQCTNRWDKHNDTYHYIGQCYYVKFLDSEGNVTVDGNKLTLADCSKNTNR